MAELHDVQLKNYENKHRNVEYYSTKSIDDSKTSVYYTPTDGTFSPGHLQVSPIHINYINENLDSLIGLKPNAATKFEFDQYTNRFKLRLDPAWGTENVAKRTADFINVEKLGQHDYVIDMKVGQQEYDKEEEEQKKRSSNEDNCCACDNSSEDTDDDDDEERANGAAGGGSMKKSKVKLKEKVKLSVLAHENDMLLVNDINVCDVFKKKPYMNCLRVRGGADGLGDNKNRSVKKKRYNQEYYYSVENVFDAKALPCKIHQHHQVHQNHHHQFQPLPQQQQQLSPPLLSSFEQLNKSQENHLEKDHFTQSSVEQLNIIMDETGNSMLFNQCDNLLQTSASLPEIQLMTTSVEIHEKHVLRAADNTNIATNNTKSTNNVDENGEADKIRQFSTADTMF